MKKNKQTFMYIIYCIIFLTSCSNNNSKETKSNLDTLSKQTNNQTAIVKVDNAILKQYYNNGQDLGGNNCKSYILLSIKSNIVKAIYYDCENEYNTITYLDGELSGLKIKGKSITISDGGGGGNFDKSEGDFNMELSNDSNKLKYKKSEFLISNLKYSFSNIMQMSGVSVEKKKKIYESPNTISKVLSEINLKKDKVELIEIGNYEKIGKDYDIWYRVKINEFEGWFYGGIKL